MRLLLSICLLSSTALAQFDNVAFVGALKAVAAPANSPDAVLTNISTLYGWWPVHGNFSDTVGAQRLTNRATWTTAGDLTNSDSVWHPILQAAIYNSYDGICFGCGSWPDNNSFLDTGGYSPSQPHEIFFVLSVTNNGKDIQVLFDAAADSTPRNLVWLSSKLFTMYAGALVDVGVAVTNKYFVLDTLLNGTTSTNWTNNVMSGQGDAGANTMSNLRLGSGYQGTNYAASYSLLEAASFKANLSATDRSNVFYYFTNKFAIAP